MRFLKDADYSAQIRSEILRLIDGSTPTTEDNTKLLTAEMAAIAQMKNFLSGRFDIVAIFTPNASEPDTRDKFIVMIAVDLTLYHLYSQTPHKDLPKHRSDRYQDAIDWLKMVAVGSASSNLPSIITEETPGDIRIWSKPPENHVW